MALLRNRKRNEFTIARREDESAHDAEWEEMLQPVWRNGALLRDQTLAEIRSRSEDVGALSGPAWAFN